MKIIIEEIKQVIRPHNPLKRCCICQRVRNIYKITSKPHFLKDYYCKAHLEQGKLWARSMAPVKNLQHLEEILVIVLLEK